MAAWPAQLAAPARRESEQRADLGLVHVRRRT